MHRLTAACSLALFVYPVGIGAEAPAPIGVAITKGEFRIDNHTVSGNATIFDGNTLETFTNPSELRIQGGVRVLLDAGSRAKVFDEYVTTFDQFMNDLATFHGFEIYHDTALVAIDTQIIRALSFQEWRTPATRFVTFW